MKNKAIKPKRHIWAAIPIKAKLTFTVMMMLAAMSLMVYFTFAQSALTMQETYAQESDYYNINSFMNTLIAADEQLENYLRHPDIGQEYVEEWEADTRLMRQQLDRLNLNKSQVGTERYLLANAMRNGFIPYMEHCQTLLGMWEKSNNMIEMYSEYATIEMISGYLRQYTRQLQSEALSDGQALLAELRIKSQRMNDLFLGLAIVAGLLLVGLLYELVRSIVTPVMRLAEASKAISDGNFDTPDVVVENRDEIYTLTKAFNRMKSSMKRLFATMQEKNEMEQQLHQREMDAVENRRLMEQAKMQQLRSQINPHFLFNTLNIISRTARKEQAPASEKLILSLARLFRYGLKTDDKEVSLQREINIVNDYVSIQTTRFENRIAMYWRVAPDLDTEAVLVPAFTFQPIVENAIIHGLEPKVEGGVIRIRVHSRAGVLHIILSDNGVGMEKAALQKLLGEESVRGDVSGIGVGNVRSRLQLINPASTFTVHSRIGRGTCVHITLPQCTEITP